MSIPATEAVSTAPSTAPLGMFGTPATTGTPTAGGATTETSTSADKDMFLKLLVAQMKYQDPMNPTDSSQFLAQSAQFTSLEKMQSVADRTAQLVSSQMAFGASTLVGRTVSWTDADGTDRTGAVDGVQFGSDAGPQLSVGGTLVALNQVRSVTSGATAATTGLDAATTDSVSGAVSGAVTGATDTPVV